MGKLQTNFNKMCHFSNRYGRLTVVVIGMMMSSLFGLIKTFSINYPMYLVVNDNIMSLIKNESHSIIVFSTFGLRIVGVP